MEKHEYVAGMGVQTGSCAYRPHATARICNERKDHPIHAVVAEAPAAALAARMAQAFSGLARQPEVTAQDLIPALQAWDAYAAQVRDTIIRKSQGYGDAWQEQGYMGNLARVLSKASRLKNVAWKDEVNPLDPPEIHDELLADTIVDLGALCAFLLANVEAVNRWGRS